MMYDKYCLNFLSIVMAEEIFVTPACLESCMVKEESNSSDLKVLARRAGRTRSILLIVVWNAFPGKQMIKEGKEPSWLDHLI